MALIIEDGTVVANANSYTSVDDLRTYAQLRGIDITTATDPACEVMLIKAMDYLEAQRDRFKGSKANVAQELQWPRSGVYDVEWAGSLLANNTIPRELRYAQLALAVEAKDNDLQPNRLPTDRGPVSSQKIGSITTAYENKGWLQSTPAFAKADALLAPLYKNNGLTLVRT